MPVTMANARRDRLIVRVLMMQVVFVLVVVLDFVMRMKVCVALRDMEPDSDSHEQARDNQRRMQVLTEEEHGHQRAHERRGREIGPGAGRAEISQCSDQSAHAIVSAQRAIDPAVGPAIQWRLLKTSV